MPLLRINAGPDSPVLHETTEPLIPALTGIAASRGPVIVMIHGFTFRPGDPMHCPHKHIFALETDPACRRAVSWPKLLGIGNGAPQEGLGIAFGWQARGSLWQAQRSAAAAGMMLADLVRHIHRLDPGRPVHLIAHSLGAQVAFAALGQLNPGDLDRIVLLNAAAFQSQAAAAMTSPAGERAQLFNISSGENAAFDALFEWMVRSPQRGDRALGRGYRAANAVTLRIDDARFLQRLSDQGIAIARHARTLCHWSTYLRPGVFNLYRALLCDDAPLTLAELRRLAEPDTIPNLSGRRILRGWRPAC